MNCPGLEQVTPDPLPLGTAGLAAHVLLVLGECPSEVNANVHPDSRIKLSEVYFSTAGVVPNMVLKNALRTSSGPQEHDVEDEGGDDQKAKEQN